MISSSVNDFLESQMSSQVYDLSLELLEALDPSMSPPWNGMSHNYDPITWDEVMSSMVVPEPLDGEDDWTLCQLNWREQHCGRIRWLIENGWDDAIHISMLHAIWPIADGNHRLAAAFLMGRETIKATIELDDETTIEDVLSGARKLFAA